VNDRASSAYFSSIILHGTIVVLIALLAYSCTPSSPKAPKIMELVAGPGDNYMATEATKLGAENGIEVNLPAVPIAAAPTPPAPDPTPADTAPVTPVEPVEVAPPTPKAPTKTTKSTTKPPPNPMAKSVNHGEIVAESRAKMLKAKQDRERKKAEAAAAKQAQASAYAKYIAGLKGQAVKGKAGGVAAGTSMADGAGGKALTAEQQDAMAAWIALLSQRWRDGFVPPPDFDQKMLAHVSFHVSASGSISSIHVTGSNGGPAFESAVAEALRHVTVPPPPSKKGDEYTVDFTLKDQG
jgi:colicin import membrane protein